MAASRITLDHFALFGAKQRRGESSGVVPTTVKPKRCHFLPDIGEAHWPRLISRLSSAMISLGVPAGTTNANETLALDLLISGFGRVRHFRQRRRSRLAVTASARSFPSWICGTAGGNDVNAIGV